jgi:hypothetical protein
MLEEYTITEDGRLLVRAVEREWVEAPGTLLGGYLQEISGTERQEEVPFHGDLTFYASNVTASAPEGIATEDDVPPFWREYTVRFTNDRLEWIKGGLSPEMYEGRTQLPREELLGIIFNRPRKYPDAGAEESEGP